MPGSDSHNLSLDQSDAGYGPHALRGCGRLQRGIVGIALCCAAKEAGAIGFVHWRTGLHPRDEIPVGKDQLAVGFQIGRPRSNVSADLVAWTTGPVHDQSLLPQRAYVAHQLLVAGMQDVDVSKTQLVEFGNQMAVEGRAFGAFIDPPHGYAGG